MTRHRVADADAVWVGEVVGVVVGGLPVLLANVDGTLHAYEDRCAHKGVALSRGCVDGRTLTCWAHGWQYDLATGEGVNPSGVRLRRVPVGVEADGVYVEVTDEHA